MIKIEVCEHEGLDDSSVDLIELAEFTPVALAYWLRSNPGSRWESAFALERLLQVTPTLFVFDVRDQGQDTSHFTFRHIGGSALDNAAV